MIRKSINILFIVIIGISLILILVYNFGQKDEKNNFLAKRIAHAGGGIYNRTYTNSFEALNQNINNGFEYFEMDFSFTRDYELVNIHDWKHSFKRSFGFEKNKKPSLAEFINLRNKHSKFTKATLNELKIWLNNNPNVKIITDVKEKNILALEIIAKRYLIIKIKSFHKFTIRKIINILMN